MDIILGLGSNQGDRFAALKKAITKLTPALKNIRLSSVYSSPALLLPDSPPEWNMDFLNMGMAGSTALPPEELLALCQQIEAEMGRNKIHTKWSPRVIDIDILTYGNQTHQSPTLTIPHPLINERAFVLLPLHELGHSATLPLSHSTISIGQFA